MKTERRHELQTNTLAVTLARWIEQAKPYSRAALAAIITVIVVLCAWSLLSAQNKRRAADGWSDFYEAMNDRDPQEKLSSIAEQYTGTSVGEWARLALADTQLTSGTNRLLAQKQLARDELRQAADTYQSVLKESQDSMQLQQATYGLARAHEAQAACDKSTDKLEQARDEYRSIAERWPDSPYAATSKARAADLEQASTKSFYDWLARYEPPRSLGREPGMPGVKPDFMQNLETEAPASATPGTPPLSLGTPAGTPPAEGTPPAADTPAEEKPAEPAAADAEPAQPTK